MCSAYARSASMPNFALPSSSCDTLTRHEPKATRSGFPGSRVGTTEGGKSANSGSSGGQTGWSSTSTRYGVAVPGGSPVTSTRA